ncbi:D-alanine--D-alanine ligase [Actinocatenispora thailandica]|uniref:D-alanine--D-alanine ligase n=1 Tax=Actinocatenispora thailandica TaxID=227318 RepID=A0A7R7I0R5_9ACTN|nr:D-alanine--D-alanine ligase [Actinocatenispora thailandica]BCJ38886.1 D-alanine--D-alanine ligase [Actinocatenispora thailandica]
MTAELPPRVLVVAGGLSYERDVSLRSGRRVVDALTAAGLDVELRDVDVTLLPYLSAERPDAVFPAVHGSPGEDGSLPGVLDLVGVPYVGSTARAARLAWDKASAKSILSDAGIATPPWVTLPHSTFSELGAQSLLDHIVARLGLPLVVKPVHGGSGLGVAAVRSADALPAAMVGAFSYAPTVLIERFVPGVDVAVSVLDEGDGPRALPAVEIEPPDGNYDYAARYTAGITTWHCPARLPEKVLDEVSETAVRVHTVLGLRDLSRIDMIVGPDGEIQVLEANTAPGMTETSLLPMAVEAAGLRLGSVLHNLAARASARGR